jgi:hypothetical protein
MTKEISLIPTTHEMQALETICKYAVDSKYFQSLGGMPGVMCIAMYAREIGVSPMTAIMGGFSNVQGKITMSAELMHSLLRGAGVRLKITQSDNTRCEIYGKRSDTGDEYTSIYTIEDARKANLVKSGGAWEKNTSDMLFARCISRLRRRLAPDIATKAYVEGEVEDDKETVEVVEIAEVSPVNEESKTAFKDKFKEIENMDYDLDDFVKFISEKSGKSADDTIKQAIKHTDKFSKSYLKWVEEKIAMEAKPVDVKAEQIDMINLK